MTSGLRIRYIASPSHDSGDFGLSDLIYRFTFSVAVVISDLRIRYVAFASWYSQKRDCHYATAPFLSLTFFRPFQISFLLPVNFLFKSILFFRSVSLFRLVFSSRSIFYSDQFSSSEHSNPFSSSDHSDQFSSLSAGTAPVEVFPAIAGGFRGVSSGIFPVVPSAESAGSSVLPKPSVLSGSSGSSGS